MTIPASLQGLGVAWHTTKTVVGNDVVERVVRLAAGGSGVISSGLAGGELAGILGGISSAFTALGMLALAIAANNRAKRKELRSEMSRAYRRGRRDVRRDLGLPPVDGEEDFDDEE